jgi:hypothetical protein
MSGGQAHGMQQEHLWWPRWKLEPAPRGPDAPFSQALHEHEIWWHCHMQAVCARTRLLCTLIENRSITKKLSGFQFFSSISKIIFYIKNNRFFMILIKTGFPVHRYFNH